MHPSAMNSLVVGAEDRINLACRVSHRIASPVVDHVGISCVLRVTILGPRGDETPCNKQSYNKTFVSSRFDELMTWLAQLGYQHQMNGVLSYNISHFP